MILRPENQGFFVFYILGYFVLLSGCFAYICTLFVPRAIQGTKFVPRFEY
jgi:hypothetical protein